ncbi:MULTISPECIES: hypothetical protein [unclassified Luteimonas]
MKLHAPLLALFPLLLLFAGDADADAGMDIQNATGNCQSALPVFDGQIRKRPMAIGNEGDAPAFVTCSLSGDFMYQDDTSALQVLVRNHGAGTSTINCTLVGGWEKEGAVPLYLPQSRVVAENGFSVFQWWPTEDQPLTGPMNLSCMLPPGTTLNTTLRSWYGSPNP